MPSLKADFEELLERIKQGRDLGHASFEPVYYLVFKPRHIVEVKRRLPAWMAKLRNEGWECHRFSISEAIADILGGARLRKIWLKADSKAPLAWEKTNEALANALRNGPVQQRLEAVLETVAGQRNGIVLVTDLEALHPYLRIGALESQLYGKFSVPTVFLYPGERTGKTRLKFLGFYPEDGNYRSLHVGG